jgi:hypothetical protein
MKQKSMKTESILSRVRKIASHRRRVGHKTHVPDYYRDNSLYGEAMRLKYENLQMPYSKTVMKKIQEYNLKHKSRLNNVRYFVPLRNTISKLEKKPNSKRLYNRFLVELKNTDTWLKTVIKPAKFRK